MCVCVHALLHAQSSVKEESLFLFLFLNHVRLSRVIVGTQMFYRVHFIVG